MPRAERQRPNTKGLRFNPMGQVGKRVRKPPNRFGERLTDGEIKSRIGADWALLDSLVQADTADDADDFDWLPAVPGRPAPFPTTWAAVYKPLSILRDTAGRVTGHTIICREKCGQIINLNGKLQEIGATATPHGKMRKPPVCHIASWVALEVVMNEQETLAGKRLTDGLRRAVCWDTANLRPGHNGCNAGGVKTTISNLGTTEKAAAKAVYDRVVTRYTALGLLIWQP